MKNAFEIINKKKNEEFEKWWKKYVKFQKKKKKLKLLYAGVKNSTENQIIQIIRVQ